MIWWYYYCYYYTRPRDLRAWYDALSLVVACCAVVDPTFHAIPKFVHFLPVVTQVSISRVHPMWFSVSPVSPTAVIRVWRVRSCRFCADFRRTDGRLSDPIDTAIERNENLRSITTCRKGDDPLTSCASGANHVIRSCTPFGSPKGAALRCNRHVVVIVVTRWDETVFFFFFFTCRYCWTADRAIALKGGPEFRYLIRLTVKTSDERSRARNIIRELPYRRALKSFSNFVCRQPGVD